VEPVVISGISLLLAAAIRGLSDRVEWGTERCSLPARERKGTEAFALLSAKQGQADRERE